MFRKAFSDKQKIQCNIPYTLRGYPETEYTIYPTGVFVNYIF